MEYLGSASETPRSQRNSDRAYEIFGESARCELYVLLLEEVFQI